MPTRKNPVTETISSPPCLYMALELAGKEWKLAFSDGSSRKPRRRAVSAATASTILPAEVKAAREKLGLPKETLVRSVYEAGWDGFWVHRMLEAHGYENVVIDPTSLQVDRRRRRAKTDRLDADKLVTDLVRHHRGERVWRTIRIPSIADEDGRRSHRERQQLKGEVVALANRCRGLLQTQGVQTKWSALLTVENVASLLCWDGSPLPKGLAHELERLVRRLQLVREQLKKLEKQIAEEIAQADTKASQQAQQLGLLRAVSQRSGLILAREIFAWRDIKNRRQLGSLVGLTGTPYDSGGTVREQGISKAGNRRVRALMVELAWSWLRYQPDSKLSHWFQERFAKGTKRTRRVGIVALARKLLVAFWQFLETGVVPEGAVLRTK